MVNGSPIHPPRRARILARKAIRGPHLAALASLAALLCAAVPARASSSLVDKLKEVKASEFPSANTVLVVDDQSVVYQASGKFAITVHEVRKLLTPAGVHAADSTSLDYEKGAETLDVVSARVIKHGGKIIPVPSSDIQNTEQSGAMNIYDPNGRAVKITYPDLAVGDAVDLTYRMTQLTPTRDGFFADIFLFQSGAPIIEASYRVNGPAALPLTAALYHPKRAGDIATTKQRQGNRILYRWAAHHVPQVIPEPLMNATTELPTLVVSTDPSWNDFSRWWYRVSKSQMVAGKALRAKVAALTRNARTPQAKIHALYNFVAANIRYRGLGVGPRTGYTPRKADATYTSRWGVCRDVAILLATMLRTAGFQAYPVLTNVGDPVLPKVAYEGFNHAIVAMPVPGKPGSWTYLDPTAKNSSDLLPGMEREQSALVCTPKGQPLGTIPPAPPANNLGHAVATTVIAPDGTMTSTVKLESKGIFDMVLRSVAATASPDQQRQMVEQLIHSALPGAKLVSFQMSSAAMLWKPMEVKLVLRAPKAATRTGRYRLLRTAVTSGALGLVEGILPRILGSLPTRKYTLDAHLTFEYDEDETVKLPAHTHVLALPNAVHVANAVTALTARCKRTGADTLSCHRSFQIKSRFIHPGEYAQLRAVLAEMGQVAHQPVILSAAGKSR